MCGFACALEWRCLSGCRNGFLDDLHRTGTARLPNSKGPVVTVTAQSFRRSRLTTPTAYRNSPPFASSPSPRFARSFVKPDDDVFFGIRIVVDVVDRSRSALRVWPRRCSSARSSCPARAHLSERRYVSSILHSDAPCRACSAGRRCRFLFGHCLRSLTA